MGLRVYKYKDYGRGAGSPILGNYYMNCFS